VQHCAACGAHLLETGACASCGRRDIVISPLASGGPRIETFAPSIIVAGPDQESGDHMIRVSDPDARSEARLNRAGQVSLNVEGADSVGRKGEARALKTLRQKLQHDGRTKVAISQKTARDELGEDAVLAVDEHRYVVQVVTAPSDERFWRAASTGSGRTQVETQRAVEWLRESVNAKAQKTSPAERPRTVILVDARHAGHLATPPILDSYITTFGSPTLEFGLASIWVVGPTVEYCARLGEGTP